LDPRGRLGGFGGKVGSSWGIWGQRQWYIGLIFLRVLVPAQPGCAR